MEKISINKEGKSKEEIIRCIENMVSDYGKEIRENNILIKREENKYHLSANKNILFINFWIKAIITASDNEIILEFDTNAPKRYQNEAIEMLRKMVNEVCN